MYARKYQRALYHSERSRDCQSNVVRGKWWRDSISKINSNNECEENDDQAESTANDHPAAMVIVVQPY